MRPARSVALALLLMAPSLAQAQGIPEFRVLHDADGRRTLDDVTAVAENAWEAPPAGPLGLAPTEGAFWLRVALPQGGGVLELDSPELDRVGFHALRDGAWERTETGDHLPFASRAIEHPSFAFPIPPGDEPALVYLRIATEGTVEFPLRHWQTEAAFQGHAMRLSLTLGAFYAFVLALALYNLFLFFRVRQRAYLFYVAFQVSLVVFAAAYEGHAAMLLWSDWPWMANVAGPTFLGLTYGFACLYLRDMTAIAKHYPRVANAMWVVSAYYFALAALSWVSYRWATAAIILSSTVTLLLGPAPALLTWRRGWTPSRWVLLGMLVMVPPSVLGAFRAAGVIEPSWLTRHGFELAVAIDALMLSFALADRIGVLRRRVEAAQTEALAQQRRALEATESERRRIARDLHDGVGQQLSVLVSRLDGVDEELGQMARETVGEIRRVSRDLHPHELERLGLSEALAQVAEQSLAAAGIDAEVVVEHVDDAVPRDDWLPLFRIAQEALHNTVRHAEATYVTVVLRRRDDGVELRVEDDGRGIAPSDAVGLGTATMRERASQIGSALEVSSPPTGGTIVSVVLRPHAPTPSE